MKQNMSAIKLADGQVQITVICPGCGFNVIQVVPGNQFDWYAHTGDPYKAFPSMKPDHKRILASGICGKCLDIIGDYNE